MANGLFVPDPGDFQRTVTGYGNSLMQQQQIGQERMETQNMASAQQKRMELEQTLRTSDNPERAGYEWAKRNDPQMYQTMTKTYIERFRMKVPLSPKAAAAELENATGEKLEVGERFTKFALDNGEAFYVDNFNPTRPPFMPKDAKELADVQNDAKTVTAGGRVKQYNSATGTYDKDLGAATEKVDQSNQPYEDYRTGDPVKMKAAADWRKLGDPGDQRQPPQSQFAGRDAQGNPQAFIPERGGPGRIEPIPGLKGPLQTKTQSVSEEKATADILTSEQKVINLGKLFKPEYVGPIQGRLNTLKIKTPGIKIDRGLADFVAVNTTLKNEVIKFITGAQMSEPEAQRIMMQLPSIEDKPEVWQSKYDITLQNIQIMKQKMQQTGYGSMGGAGGAAPSSGAPKILKIERVQ